MFNSSFLIPLVYCLFGIYISLSLTIWVFNFFSGRYKDSDTKDSDTKDSDTKDSDTKDSDNLLNCPFCGSKYESYYSDCRNCGAPHF